MTTRDDLAWYENELSRANTARDHEVVTLYRWKAEEIETACNKIDRIFDSEYDRLEATYEARVRWLESEIERLTIEAR